MSKIKLFVPLGTQKYPFNRLVLELNKLVKNGLYLSDEIIMQSAIYEIQPAFTHYGLIPFDQFNNLVKEAEVIITHSGVNSIITCMKLQKPLIIVPRLKQYGEHVDDHQQEIAEVMKIKYNVLVLDDLSKLRTYIECAKTHPYRPWISHNEELINCIKHIISKSEEDT